MVAGDGGAAERNLRVGAASRVEGAGDQIAQVHDQIGCSLGAQVGQHGFEGEQVAVSVGKDGNAHQSAPIARLVTASSRNFRMGES